MEWFIGLVILLAVINVAAFYRLPALVWSILLAVALITISILGWFSIPFVLLAWILFLPAALFANLKHYRQRYLLTPAIPRLKQQLPTISATERVAIDAGDTWWEKELFCGSPKWSTLFNYPKPTLTDEEQAFLENQVNHVCSMVSDWTIVHELHDLPKDVWNYLKNERFFGMVIPKEYGGRGFSALAHSSVVAKLASHSGSLAVNTMVPNSLGPGELLVHYGTDEQKNYYLPRLARGEEIPCFALTGPDAGSDAGSITDHGIVCRGMHEGVEILGIRLTWDKRYITLAPIATILGVAFQLYDPDHLLGDKEHIGITLCLIPTTHPGVNIGERHLPVFQAFMNGPTSGENVFIPLSWIIGGEKMAGQGWRMLMECLSIGRAISLPALGAGISSTLYRYTGAYAKVREQFNTSIANFEGVQEALGFIAGYAYMTHAGRLMTAGAVDLKINPSIVSAIAKCHLTEMTRRSVTHAMDVHAGHAIQAGPRNNLLMAYLCSPISITVEGANILTRNLIIFGQGAIRCHPYILDEVSLISAEKTDTDALDRTLMAHIGFYASNLIRAFAYGLTGGCFIRAPLKQRKLRCLSKQLTRMSTGLALLADTALILLGGSLKRRESISARLGDIMSQLYLASTVMKYFKDEGEPEADIDNVRWALKMCLHHSKIAFDDILHNFPVCGVGGLMRFILFPWGSRFPKPDDELHHAVVEPMLSANPLRERLTKILYFSQDNQDCGWRLERALVLLPTVEPLRKKIRKGIKAGGLPGWLNYQEQVEAAVNKAILTRDEANQVLEYEALRKEIIKVNKFSFDLSTVID